MDLIHSKNEFAMETSLKQLKGSLSEKIRSLRKEIVHSVAFMTLSIIL